MSMHYRPPCCADGLCAVAQMLRRLYMDSKPQTAMQAPRFAAPRPSLPGQHQENDLKPSRHSAPGVTIVPHDNETDAIVSKAEMEPQPANNRGMLRHSMPAVLRKPLACMSNKVQLKPKACDGSTSFGSKTLSSGAKQAEAADILPVRKRKLDHNAATRAISSKICNTDDDDFA